MSLAVALLAATAACARPPVAAVAAPEVPIEPGCYLVDGGGEDTPALPSHLILTAEPSAAAVDRRAVRLRLGGERVDDAGWWHHGTAGVVVLFDPASSSGLERWSIAVIEGEIRARFVNGGGTRSVRLFAGCD